jgi:hypothetical protein
MNGAAPPAFPGHRETEDEYLSALHLPAFAGMQIRNGPYGAVSAPGASEGHLRACAERELGLDDFHAVLTWVIAHAADIRAALFPALLEQYSEVRHLAFEEPGGELSEVVLPEIGEAGELAALCGVAWLHVGGITTDGQPQYGIELGCEWEPEHGAGVRFAGLTVVEAGDASAAFMFSDDEG